MTKEINNAIHPHMSNYQKYDLERYSEVFKALSNPNRLAIFLHLVACCPPGTSCSFEEEVQRCIGDLGKGLQIAPSTISHHIKELRIAGLIHVAKRGRFTKCWVDAETVGRLTDLLNGRFALDGVCEDRQCGSL
ncbi:MAG: metalloregulator ArsR/SmtB family transcription factor [Deltaproteobacteria bacterium]|nr:metalloregulator ArsR/SmtB family transcription factor [Deltaproteobacteria bacterium]